MNRDLMATRLGLTDTCVASRHPSQT
jgi:hypothetical protein